jgi:hypothetical protein
MRTVLLPVRRRSDRPSGEKVMFRSCVASIVRSVDALCVSQNSMITPSFAAHLSGAS